MFYAVSRSLARPLFCGASALVIFAGTMPGAADAQQRLDPTVVTATRTLTPPDQIGSSITVITRQEIEERGYQDVVSAIEGVAGINVVQNGGRGKQTSIFTRGTESNHTLVLINGARMIDSSTTGGVFQIEHLNTADVERIEIVRGPQSVLYGSDAVGGVINIITRQGAPDGAVASGAIEGGSHGTTEWRTGIDATAGRLDLNVHYNNFRTGGISAISPRVGGREEDGNENQQVSLRADFRATEHFETGFYGQFLEVENDIDPFVDDPNAEDRYRQGLFISEVRLKKLFAGRVGTTFRHSYLGIKRSVVNPPDARFPFGSPTSRFTSDKHKVEAITTIRLFEGNRLTLGQEVEWERAKAQNAFLTFSGETRNLAFYIQDQFAFSERLFGTAGIRVDDHSRFGTEVTWRVTGTYHLRETGTRFKGTVGTGFKAPSLEDLFGFNPGFPPFFPAFRGNPNLEPETSFGFDFGAEQKLWSGRIRFGATFFYNRIDDLIQPNASFTTTINLQETRNYGIESFAEADLGSLIGRPLFARVTYTYLRAEDVSNDTELLRRPRHSVTFDLRAVPIEKLTVNFRVVYDGYRADVGFLNFARIYEPGRIVARLSVEYRIAEQVTLFGRIENLFDSQAENPNGFNQPGLSAFAGLRVRFRVPFDMPQI